MRARSAMEAVDFAYFADSAQPLALAGHHRRRWHPRAAPREPLLPLALRRPLLRRIDSPQSHCPQTTTTAVPPRPLDSAGQCQSLPANLQGPSQQYRRLEWPRHCSGLIEVVVGASASASASAPAAALRAMVWEPGYHLSDRKELVEEAAAAAAAAAVVVVSDDAPFLAEVVAAAEVAATVVLPCGEVVACGGVDCDVGEADLRHCYSSSSVFALYKVRHIRHRRTVPAAAAAVDDALAVAAGHFDHIVVLHQDHTAVVAAHHQDHPRGSWSCCPPATSSAAVAVDTVAAAAPPWPA